MRRSEFETREATWAERRVRLEHLRSRIEQAERVRPRKGNGAEGAYGFDVPAAERLYKRLRQARPGGASSFASPAYSRRFRLLFCGAVFRLIRLEPPKKLRVFTLIPQLTGWRVRGADLCQVEPKALLERFRQQLVRSGLARKDGILIAYLHGDYDPTEDVYQLHLHGLATDGALEVLKSLKRLPAYRASASASLVRVPHRVTRLKARGRQGTYNLAQLIWPSRTTFLNQDGQRKRGKRGRIPAPRYAEFLIWLDQQSFGDLFLLRGCRIRGGELKSTPRCGRKA